MGLFGGFKAKFSKNAKSKKKPDDPVVCIRYVTYTNFDDPPPQSSYNEAVSSRPIHIKPPQPRPRYVSKTNGNITTTNKISSPPGSSSNTSTKTKGILKSKSYMDITKTPEHNSYDMKQSTSENDLYSEDNSVEMSPTFALISKTALTSTSDESNISQRKNEREPNVQNDINNAQPHNVNQNLIENDICGEENKITKAESNIPFSEEDMKSTLMFMTENHEDNHVETTISRKDSIQENKPNSMESEKQTMGRDLIKSDKSKPALELVLRETDIAKSSTSMEESTKEDDKSKKPLSRQNSTEPDTSNVKTLETVTSFSNNDYDSGDSDDGNYNINIVGTHKSYNLDSDEDDYEDIYTYTSCAAGTSKSMSNLEQKTNAHEKVFNKVGQNSKTSQSDYYFENGDDKEEDEKLYKINYVQHNGNEETSDIDEVGDISATSPKDNFKHIRQGYSNHAASIFFGEDEDDVPERVRHRNLLRNDDDNESQGSSASA